MFFVFFLYGNRVTIFFLSRSLDPDTQYAPPLRTSSPMPTEQAGYYCRCDRCHGGKKVSKRTFYVHGNRLKRKLSQRTQDRILSLPDLTPKIRRRRSRRRNGRLRRSSTDGVPSLVSKRVSRSGSVRMRLDGCIYAPNIEQNSLNLCLEQWIWCRMFSYR